MKSNRKRPGLWGSVAALHALAVGVVALPPTLVATANPTPVEVEIAGITSGSPEFFGAASVMRPRLLPSHGLAEPWRDSPGDMWMPEIRRCRSELGRAYCDGPRWVPRGYGPAAKLAAELGLGTEDAAAKLLRSRPFEHWLVATPPSTGRALLRPVAGANFGRGFGLTRIERPDLPHEGIDFGAPIGAQIRAVDDGLVAYSDNGVHGYGNLVLIIHGDGSTTAYAHCRATFVFAGETVTRGQVIAEVGNSGLSTGPHLHFELHRDGDPVDPIRYFE